MKILKLTMLVFGFLLFNTASCKKDESDGEKLPLETQEGKNTFGCLVNGQIWLPNNWQFGVGYSLYASVINNELSIGAHNGKSQIEKGIFISTLNLNGAKTYYLDSKNQFAVFENFVSNCFYSTDSIHNLGELEITKLDTVNRIISGRFNFIAKIYSSGYNQSSSKCDTIVNVSEGRFDIIYSK